MARPRKYPRPEDVPPPLPQTLAPKGAFYSIIQLPIDLQPKPSAQRILLMLNMGDEITTYVSENAYIRVELFELYNGLQRQAYNESIMRGAPALIPQPTKIHWCRFTEDFAKTGAGPRVEPHKDFLEAFNE